ncbi:MAG: glycoside hydrolase family 3 C-terminal domain-containing protein, partial [Actinobacteria bacterium]|nr:glycoside hydrolase family 3 C-terminal domain-containing protein [Actinomycetota bacterium]
DSWRTHGSEALGLRPLVTSDGPAGARGVSLDDRSPSSCLPSPSALGATWDPDLVREVAAALGAEARAKGIDVLLAPTINLMRTPLGGRGFECFSEDPQLSARIAVGYVRGLQGAGVAATVKHYTGNDSETGRWRYDARISEQVLREVYLVPFEACVREAGVMVVMAAYNSVNGQRMTEHARLLREVLKGEWGFRGVVVSDWEAVRSTVASAVGGVDLAMPGPNRYWGRALADAVRAGLVPEEVIDEKLARLLGLARWAGALDGAASGPDGARARLADPGLLRRAAAASFVLLRNERQTLPLDAASLRRVAVIGPNAVHPVIQGGGSAGVSPVALSLPGDALRAALGARAEVTVAAGCRIWTRVPVPPPGSLRDPESGEPGVRLEFRGPDGMLLAGEHRQSTTLAWWDGSGLPGFGWGKPGTVVMRARFQAGPAGRYVIGAAAVGRLTVRAGGRVLAAGYHPMPADPVETMTRSGELRTPLQLTAGQVTEVAVEFTPAADGDGPLALRVGIAAEPDEDELMEQAVTAAARADAAVVVIGTADGMESEGFDRDTLALPGRQDELVRRVTAVNPRTAVVVNAGMPVLMPWAGQAAAVVHAWLPGQAMGDALADVLLGRAEPGGRLPVSLPAAEADCPVLHAVPAGGRLEYSEGLLIGYRGYQAAGRAPAFPFGHGLGYTCWAYESLAVSPAVLAAGEDLTLRVRVRNTGQRPGREVVQAYVGPRHPANGRPARILGGFATAAAGPGEATEVTITVPARVFAVYDEAAGGWSWPPGEFVVSVGRSSGDRPLSAAVRSGGPEPPGGGATSSAS